MTPPGAAVRLQVYLRMPRMMARYFGEIDYADAAVFYFPCGIPGFENEHEFLLLNRPNTDPLVFMQSRSDANLCFTLIPILVADPRYRLHLGPEERSALHLGPDEEPRIGEEIFCAAVVCSGNGGPTANLKAPIVVNIAENIGIQAIQTESAYGYRHPVLPREEELVSCS